MIDALRARIAIMLPHLTLAVFVAVILIGAFSGGLWGGAGIGLGLLLFFGTAFVEKKWPVPLHCFLGMALLTLVLIALLNIGSSAPKLSWYDWTRLVTIFIPLSLLTAPDILPHADSRHLFAAAAVAGFLAATTLGLELSLGAPLLHLRYDEDAAALTRYNRGLSYLVVFAWPSLAWLILRAKNGARNVSGWLQLAAFFAMLLFVTGLTESRAAKLALVLALAVAGAAYVAPKLTRGALTVLLLLLPAWPFAARYLFAHGQAVAHLPASWRARVEIWDYMSYRIAEHPWLGWGLGTSKTLDFQNPHGALYVITTQAASHPHNVGTQLWVELGLPGLALGLLFGFLTLWRASRLDQRLAPFALAAWTAALCLSLVAYNFWTDSMFAAFALTGFAFALLQRRLSGSGPAIFR